MISPCKGCEERAFLCHAHCSRYQKFALAIEGIRKARNIYRIITAASDAETKARWRVIMQRKHGKRCRNSDV